MSVLFPIEWQKFEHVVLDFGGVLYQIDHLLTSQAFEHLGYPDFHKEFRHSSQSELFNRLECGQIDDVAFLEALQGQCAPSTQIEDVRKAWNAMLIGLRPEAQGWIQSLTAHFDLILLSNTNAIHAEHFEREILASKGRSFADPFRQIIYSHRLGKRKPDPATYAHVAQELGLHPERTLLVDDTKENVQGAVEAGWSGVYFDVAQFSFRQFIMGVGYEDFLRD